MDARTVVLLAAGKGTRMKSDLAKVLHELRGRPLVTYPIDAARDAGATRVVVVVGYQAAAVRRAVTEHAGEQPWLRFATQPEQNGTGHAVLCALPEVPPSGPVLVLSGDVPMLRAETIDALVKAAGSGAAMCTFRPDDCTGYGRIVRDASGKVVRIREQRDADPTELAIEECNVGIYCFPAEALHAELPKLGTDNAQGEVYLTDLVEVLAATAEVGAIVIPTIEALGINTREQLADLDAELCR